LTLTVTSIINNENQIGATINKINADLFIDGVRIGLIQEEGSYKLNGNDTTRLTFPARINLAQFSQIFPTLMKQDSATVQIKGIFTIDAILSSLKFNRTTEKRMPIKSELDKVLSNKFNEDAMSVNNIKLKNVSLSETNLQIDISVKNDFLIDFQLEKVDCDLFFPKQNEAFGEWSNTEASILVKAGENKNILGDTKILNKSALLQSMSMIFNKKEVIVKGKTTVNINTYIFEFPFNQKVELKGLF
jgi:hypothetical protein